MAVTNGNAGPACELDSSIEHSRLLSPPVALPDNAGITLSFEALSFDEPGWCFEFGD